MADKPQSKFWADSDSSDKESESESSSSEEEVEQTQQKTEKKNNWQFDSDSSEDEGQRIVKSARRKAEDAFENVYHQLQNAININDWNTVTVLYQKLSTLLTKHSDVVAGKSAGSIDNYPSQYFLSLKVIQNAVEEIVSTKGQKKLSKTNVKSFNGLRARLKKFITDEYQDKIDSAEARPQEDDESDDDSQSEDSSDSSSSGSSGSDSDSDSGSDSSDDDEDWKSGSGSSSSSSSDDDDDGPKLTGRARWVKRSVGNQKEEKDEERKKKAVDKQERARQRQTEKLKDAEKKAGEQEQKEEEFTEEIVAERVKEIIGSRGKKNINKMDLVSEMRSLANKAVIFDGKTRIPIIMHLIALEFDVKTGLDEFMPTPLWHDTVADIITVLSLMKNKNLILRQYLGDRDEAAGVEQNEVIVSSDLSVFIERLNNEYQKSLKNIDNHSVEYVERLRDEFTVNSLAKTVFDYYLARHEFQKSALLSLILLENNYYKHKTLAETVYKVQFEAALKSPENHIKAGNGSTESTGLGSIAEVCLQGKTAESFDFTSAVLSYANFVFAHGMDEMKSTAALCLVYHYALHDDFYKARDTLMMTKIPETVDTFEIKIQVLYNRCLAQLGFCAFKCGKIKRAHSALVDLCQHGSKNKELLAQGVYWRKQNAGKDPKALEQFQRQEKRRLLPYHMHINTDLLEFFHLTSAMLLEIPTMALQETTTGYNRPISRSFRKLLEQYQNQIFTGPPENIRDHVMAAAISLRGGDWKQASEYLLNLSVWKLFTSKVDETKAMLKAEIQKQGLRTYLISYSSMYNAVSSNHLSSLFGLEVSHVRKIVNGMIIKDEIKGSWLINDNGEYILGLRGNEPSHLQALAGRFAKCLDQIVEANDTKSNKNQGFDGSKNEERKNFHVRRISNKRPNQNRFRSRRQQ